VLSLKSGKADGWKELLNLDDSFVRVASLPADWNLVLRQGNEFFDRLTIAARTAAGPQRDHALKEIASALQQMSNESRSQLKSVATMSSAQRGEFFSSLTLALMCPGLEIAIQTQDNANIMLQLTHTAAALAIHRTTNGAYPATLDALVPGALDQLPTDPYTSKPFIYKPHANGFLLYSVGANGRDDGGSDKDDVMVAIP
jgi:hypothetical protein